MELRCKVDKVCMYRKEGASRRSADEELKKEKEKRWTGEDWLEGGRKQEEMDNASKAASPLYTYLPPYASSSQVARAALPRTDTSRCMHACVSLSLSSDGPRWWTGPTCPTSFSQIGSDDWGRCVDGRTGSVASYSRIDDGWPAEGPAVVGGGRCSVRLVSSSFPPQTSLTIVVAPPTLALPATVAGLTERRRWAWGLGALRASVRSR